MIRANLIRKLLNRGKPQQIPEPAERDAPQELAGGVAEVPQTFDQEAYPSVASPPPSSANGSRDLEDIAENELWSAIKEHAKNLIILTDEWKRRKFDDRTKKILDLLGLTDSQASASPA